jgi:hypothetical protein
MMIGEWKKLYSGFRIEDNIGNNAFSLAQRQNKSIYVPPLIEGAACDLKEGDQIAFSEIVEGQEINAYGLKNFVYTRRGDQHIFIFDNHNHAFFFWLAAFKAGSLRKALALVHVDQHTDLREPSRYFVHALENPLDLTKVFEYTNSVLNVGNFIHPALKMGLFSRLEIMNTPLSFDKTFNEEILLDIDVDIFTPEMDVLSAEYIKSRVAQYFHKAKVVTIATSPFFMDQRRAIKIIQEMLG